MFENNLPLLDIKDAYLSESSGKNYHHITSCQKTLGIDNLINRYNKDKSYLVNLIFSSDTHWVNKIWTPEGPLAMDNQCNWDMGESIRTVYICSQCKNIKRLFPSTTLPCKEEKCDKKKYTDVPILIMSGKPVGKNFIIVGQNSLEKSEILPTYYIMTEKIFFSFYPLGVNTLREIPTQSFISNIIFGDKFTMSILISWGVEHLFLQKNLPHIYASMNSFICNKKGYQIYEKSGFSFEEMVKTTKYIQKKKNIIKKNILISVLIQLIVIYNEFSTIHCIHGLPKKALYLFDSPVTYEYHFLRNGEEKTYKIDAPFTIKIGNWEMASAVLGNTLYTCTPEFWVYNKARWSQYVNNQKIDDTVYFKVNKNTGHKNYSHPYSSQFDFYSLLVEMMKEKTFYNSIYYYPKIKSWWESIWTKKTKIIIEDHLENFYRVDSKGSLGQEDIRGLWLKSTPLDILLDNLLQ